MTSIQLINDVLLLIVVYLWLIVFLNNKLSGFILSSSRAILARREMGTITPGWWSRDPETENKKVSEHNNK